VTTSERDFATAVEDALRLYSWKFTHFRPAMKQNGRWVTALSGDKGFPDYFCVRGPRALAIELKSDTGRLTPEQSAWLGALEAAGIETWVMRPRDMDRLLEVLRSDSHWSSERRQA